LSPAPIEFPVEGLSDGVVRLRLMAEADISAIVEAVQDPEIPRWTHVPEPYGEEDARHWHRMATTGYEAGTDLATLVVDADEGRLLGAVGLHNLDPATGRCSAGYWVAAPERGRGHARRALTLLSRFAFDELGAQRIELWIEPANAPSLRVAEAAGFHREGLLRSFMPIRNERRDMLMYSLLPDDPRSSLAAPTALR
jgi:[ribosomal protein S5]-alanine N-acetyltransferase